MHDPFGQHKEVPAPKREMSAKGPPDLKALRKELTALNAKNRRPL